MSEVSKINPLVAIAAVAVTAFSLVGIGIMSGLVPNSFSKNSESALQTEAVNSQSAKTASETASAPSGSPSKPKAQAKQAETKRPVQVATQAQPASAEQTKAVPVCTACGVVTSVNAVTQKGEGSGLGAVAGGVLGGVLGHQVGGGTGKKIATVAGAAGGAYAGHQVEKGMKSTTRYDVVVNMDDGTTRTFTYDTQPAFQSGAKVRVVNGALTTS